MDFDELREAVLLSRHLDSGSDTGTSTFVLLAMMRRRASVSGRAKGRTIDSMLLMAHTK